MGDVVDFVRPDEVEVITNHTVHLDGELMPLKEASPERIWFGAVTVKHNLQTEEVRMTLMAAFLVEEHAKIYIERLSPGVAAGYLSDEVIDIIIEGVSEMEEEETPDNVH